MHLRDPLEVGGVRRLAFAGLEEVFEPQPSKRSAVSRARV
jgi:hypothetical protein